MTIHEELQIPQLKFLVPCIVCKVQYTISDYPQVITEETLRWQVQLLCSEKSVSTFPYCQLQHTIIKQLHQSDLLSIVLDAAPLELIISLQHTVTKLSNHE